MSRHYSKDDLRNLRTAGKLDVLTPANLTIGSVVTFKDEVYTVIEAYQYDWGDDEFSQEFKLASVSKNRFLSIDPDGMRTVMSFSREMVLDEVSAGLENLLCKTQKPPQTIEFQDRTYTLKEEAAGYYRNTANPAESDESWEEMMNWTLWDPTKSYFLSIDQWEEDEFEIAFGKVITASDISSFDIKP